MSHDAVCAIAQGLKWSMRYAEEFAAELEEIGVFLTLRSTTQELCPCGYHYATESGLCVACETRREEELQAERHSQEESRLRREAERRLNQAKKARERMRRRFLANPRDEAAKEMLAVVDEFIELMEEADHDEPDEPDESDE